MMRKIKERINFGPMNRRNRELWLEKTLQGIEPGLRILDAGAGELRYKKFCQHLDYVSQDFGQYDGSGNGEALQEKSWDNSKLDIVSDIASIPVDDSSFDAVMCVEVLEHVPEPIKAIAEFSRILKPGGRLVLTAPVDSLAHFAPYYFYNGYSKYWHEKFLDRYGFDIIELLPNGNYFQFIAQEAARTISAAKEYSSAGRLANLFLKITSVPFILALMAVDRKNNNSEELASFGYHVLAVKRKNQL